MYQQERLSELIANAHPDGGAQAMAPGPAEGPDGIGPVEKHLHDVQARRGRGRGFLCNQARVTKERESEKRLRRR